MPFCIRSPKVQVIENIARCSAVGVTNSVRT